jgi:hypothetical protein
MRSMKLTPEKLTAFCAALAETCNVGKACAAVGISRMTAYTWRNEMPDFAEAWERAMKAGLLGLEDEAHRRAFEGVDEPVFYKGDECGTVRKYSDTLTIFLLKAHDPDKYRENSKVELSGSLALNTMSDEEIRAELAALTAGGVLHAPDDVSDLI